MVKKTLLYILAMLAIVVIVFCVIVALQPTDYTISRSIAMNASPDKIFPEVNDFRRWQAWSPWSKLDPAMKISYSGPEAGLGAIYAWNGNDQVGEGSMTIAQSRPVDDITIKIHFIRPFAGDSDSDFSFKPNGDKTDVTWTMRGKNNFIGKAFGLIMNMDKMVGSDFEKGLSQLKTVVETTPN